MDNHKNNKTFLSKSSSTILVLTFFMLFPFTHQSSNRENTTFSLANDLQDMKVEGDAHMSGSTIVFTKGKTSGKAKFSGRVTYGKPIHLWDHATNNLADFSTHISTIIDDSGFGQRFAIFIAPVDAQLYLSDGNLDHGLLNSSSKNSSSKFAAVEFFTGFTDGDIGANNGFIGIYLNSKPVNTVDWTWNYANIGGNIDSWIYFDSHSKSLRVDVSDGNSYTLSCSLDLTVLPERVTVGFLAATTTNPTDQKQQIKSWNFVSSLQLGNLTDNHTGPDHRTSSVQTLLAAAPSSSRERKAEASQKFIIGIIVGLGLVCLVLVILGLFLFWRIKRKRIQSTKDKLQRENRPTQLSFKKLAAATKNFSEEIGKGGSGVVYRGILKNGSKPMEVAVKRITSVTKRGKKEFLSEVEAFSNLKHGNLLQLVGWCYGRRSLLEIVCFHKNRKLLLVYEFMPKKSVEYHLCHQTWEFTWERRYNIVLGLASALHYLQEECRQCILHRDIKSSNVMLDSNFNSVLGDFGLARRTELGRVLSTTSELIGTWGYMAPEYQRSGKATKESDIYAFGITVLEIVSGLLASTSMNGYNIATLVDSIRQDYRTNGVPGVADRKLGRNYDGVQMKRLIFVGLACVQPDPTRRPRITEVVPKLKGQMPLPEFQDLQLDMSLSSDVAALRAIAFNNSRAASISAPNRGSENLSPSRVSANANLGEAEAPVFPFPDAIGSSSSVRDPHLS